MPAKAPNKRAVRPPIADGGQAGFAARLQLIVKQWPSADRLAKAAGVSSSAFRKWRNGAAEPGRDRLVALAEAAGVTVSWLAQGEGVPPDILSLSARARFPHDVSGLHIGQFVILPKKREAAAAGAGHPVTNEPIEFIGFRRDWLLSTFGRDAGEVILDVAVGESMEPGIRNGDLLLIDTTDRTFRNFGVYVIEARGERLVKRVQRKFDGSLILISDNEKYQAESISAALAKEVHVVGRVVWRGGEV